MADKLPKMDRWHSELLDVHTWSDHPEIKALTDRLYVEAGINALERTGNRKPKRTVKDSLRILLLDLYVKWLKDPSLSIGFSKTKSSYKVGSRYNGMHISDRIIEVEGLLIADEYLEELPAFHDKTGQGRSYTTRIRHTEKLRRLFAELTIDLHDIDNNTNRECIILHDKYVEDPKDDTVRKIDYKDEELSPDALALVERLRGQLQAYNKLLKNTFIDIPSYEANTFRRTYQTKKYGERTQTISLGPDKKFVTRVFNGGLAGNWERGGRFYGGWWQQIDKEERSKIYINDKPTLEVDFKAFHPSLLSNEQGVTLSDDPYNLGDLLLPDTLMTLQIQRDYVKLLVLMAINADSDKLAFQALRNHDRSDKLGRSLKDEQLGLLLDKFIEKHPHLKDVLNTGQALRLMWIDSQIANLILDHFTQKNIPVLCIHDSFIIQYDKEPELRDILDQATHQITKSRVGHDIKNERNTHTRLVSGNIKGFEKPVSMKSYSPIRIKPTKQYLTRKDKFSKWLRLLDEVEDHDDL